LRQLLPSRAYSSKLHEVRDRLQFGKAPSQIAICPPPSR
jgi:hypothetical protein